MITIKLELISIMIDDNHIGNKVFKIVRLKIKTSK